MVNSILQSYANASLSLLSLVDKTLTLTLVRKNYIISAHLSSGKFDKCDCEGIHLPNGTSLECGEGMKEHRSLKDINSKKRDEEVEEKPCLGRECCNRRS